MGMYLMYLCVPVPQSITHHLNYNALINNIKQSIISELLSLSLTLVAYMYFWIIFFSPLYGDFRLFINSA